MCRRKWFQTDHKTAILHPEGIPAIAGEAEEEREVQWRCSDQSEIRDLMGTQSHLVLEKKRYGNVDESSEGRSKSN